MIKDEWVWLVQLAIEARAFRRMARELRGYAKVGIVPSANRNVARRHEREARKLEAVVRSYAQ